jgi:hypothetical protein
MQDNFTQTPSPDPRGSQPRRFVYRSAHPDAHQSHPMRRCTDIPRHFPANNAPLYPRPMLLKMCVYLKVN